MSAYPGCYQRYKEDTAAFATWLAQSAESCGFQLKVQTKSTGKGKGKAKKRAKKNVTTANTFTTEELVQQAEIIANSPPPGVKVPHKVLRKLRRAIDARTRFTTWFTTTGFDNGHSNQRHAYFTEVLERALTLLEPLCVPATAPKTLKSKRKSEEALEEPSTSSLPNLFAALELEETLWESETDYEDGEEEGKKPTKPSKRPEKVWEIEEEEDARLDFIVHCFFEDTHLVRQFIRETWEKYQKKELDLQTAAMTTNLAVDVIRNSEQALLAKYPDEAWHKYECGKIDLMSLKVMRDRSDGQGMDEDKLANKNLKKLSKPGPYEQITKAIFTTNRREKDEGPTTQSHGEGTPEISETDEFVYLSTARTIMKYRGSLSALYHCYPFPVMSVADYYVDFPELQAEASVQQWKKEDEFLTQMLMDVHLMTYWDLVPKHSLSATKYSRFSMDEVTKELRAVQRKGDMKLTICTVFAARLLLDIHSTLAFSSNRGHVELLGQISTAKQTFQDAFGISNDISALFGPRNRDNFLDLEHTLKGDVDELTTTKRKLLATSTQRPQSGSRTLVYSPHDATGRSASVEAKGIEPSSDLHHLLNQNPIFCGTMSFKITVQMEWFGLTIANCAPSFLAAAHLHNAAKHLNALPTPWPAMQSLCDLHCAKIFGGSAPPTAPFEMLRRYFLQIGVPLSKFAVNARDSSMLRTRGQKRLALPLDPALELLRSCFGPDSKLERTVRQIGALDLVSGEEKLEVLSRFRGWLSRAVQAPKPEYVELSLASEKIVARICAERRRGEDAVEMVAGVLEGVVLGFWEWERESRRERGEFVAPQALKDCGVTLGQF